MKDKYTGLHEEEFEKLKSRYRAFLDGVNDVNVEPVHVFTTLSKVAMDDLVLIRDMSVNLQKKKDEDIERQRQAKEEAVAVEKPEEEKPETETEKAN